MLNEIWKINPDVFRNEVIDRQGKLGEDACKIMASAINAVDPYKCVKKHLKRDQKSINIGGIEISSSGFDRVIVIGFGKAAVSMARSAIDILGEKIAYASVVTKSEEFQKFNGYGNVLKVHLGGHPVPTAASITATQKILSEMPELTPKDVVLVLISGGGSALFTSPVTGVTLEDLQRLTDILLKSGAEIKEINTLRKHLDQVKGGRLALSLQPAKIFTLILSDVIGDRLDMIASGPTVPDPTSYKDAADIIEKYHLEDKIPQSIIHFIEDGLNDKHPETLKPGSDLPVEVKNILIGSNYQAANAVLQRARALGYRSVIITTHLTGDTQYIAEFLGGVIKSELAHNLPLKKPTCLILGGEPTVQVRGNGLGGRNQDLALRMVEKLSGIPGMLFISLATDGEDGPTDAAGAVIDGQVFNGNIENDLKEIKSYIENSNSYEYLAQKGALIKSGSTGTNVNDLLIILYRT